MMTKDDYIIDFFNNNVPDPTERLGLRKELRKEFISWFIEESTFYAPSQVCWNEEDYRAQVSSLNGLCYINSLRLTINYALPLLEGFVIQSFPNCDILSYVFHSFNLSGKKVIDYTYFKNKPQFEKRGQQLPFAYIGIKIPSGFIRKARVEIFERRYGSINSNECYSFPLMVPYYYYRRGFDWSSYQYRELH